MIYPKSIPINYSALPGVLLHLCVQQENTVLLSYEPNVLEAPGGLGGTDLLSVSIYSSGPMELWVIPHNDQS